MPRPGPNVTSDADTQPGSDSLFPTGFSGGGALVRSGSVGTGEIADGSVAAADLNLASVAAAIAARSEMTGTYAPLARRPYVAAVGDSITANGGVFDGSSTPSPRYQALSWHEIARHVGGGRWSLTGPSSARYGWATAGYTTDQIIAAGYHMSAAASNASVVVVLAGTNDLGAQTAAYIVNNLVTMWTACRNAGKIVVACTLTPRSDQVSQVIAVNQLIRQTVATMPGVVLFDAYSPVVDPSNGAFLAAYTSDGVHPNPVGAAVLGNALAPLLNSIIPAGSPPDVQIASSANQITLNPYGSGNNSGMPTSWSKFALGAGSAVATKVARTDAAGEWTNLVVTAAAPTADGIQVQANQISAKWVIGDTLVGVAELDITAGYDLRGLSAYIYGGVAASQSFTGYIATSERTALTTGIPLAGKLWLVTPVLTVPASTTSVSMNLAVYGPGTIRVGRFGVVKV